MKDDILLFFEHYSDIAVLFSLVINIIISILSIVPSFFLTAANISFFGFWNGVFISFVGEAIGAIISFYIYRKGFKKFSNKMNMKRYPRMNKLLFAEGKEAFYLILAFRLFPFVPSGIVNIYAALGKVTLVVFVLASSLGKIPALLIEAYSVLQITKYNHSSKVLLTLISIYLFIIVLKKMNLKLKSSKK